jgi:predicted permease
VSSIWDALAMQPRRLEEEIFQDLRYGIRMLLQSKGWTAVAVLSLALGIGANTALFSVVDRELFRPLPVKNPEQLVRLMWVSGPNDMAAEWRTYGYSPKEDATGLTLQKAFSNLTYERMRSANQTLSDVFAYGSIDRLNVIIDGPAEIASGQFVSGNYFTGLGVPAALGRAITVDDDRAGAAPVAVISNDYWQRRFGLDPAIVGKSVNVNGRVPVTIVGIAPRGFSGAFRAGSSLSPDLSIPLAMEPRLIGDSSALNNPVDWWLMIMGRARPGVKSEQIRANLEGAFRQSAVEGWDSYLALFRYSASHNQPQVHGEYVKQKQLMRPNLAQGIFEPRDTPHLRVLSGSHGSMYLAPDGRRSLAILVTIVGILLCIVCANVTNLLLARMATRQKEIAMRLALGARPWRLIRQLVTESVLLSLIGGILAVLAVIRSKDLIQSLFEIQFTLDWRVLAFTAAISLGTAIVIGLAPALRAIRVDLIPSLKDSAPNTLGSRSRLGKSLLVAQVAMSLVLLIGAGLFIGTLRNLHSTDLGFNPGNLLLFRVDPRLNAPDADYWAATGRLRNLYELLIERISAIPGVRSATLSDWTLLGGNSTSSDGTLSPRPGEAVSVQVVRDNFFDTMEMPILLGRGLTSRDDGNSPKVALVNEALARKFYPDKNPLEQRIGGRPGGIRDIAVVGVVRDAKGATLREDIAPTVYLPYLQSNFASMNFEVRTTRDPGALIPAIREAVHEVNPNLPLIDVKTQNEQVKQILARERLFAYSSSLFSALALLLACIGLYGTLSFSVARRTSEIGIRMALGAQRREVAGMVLREAFSVVLVGILAGFVIARLAGRWVASMLYGLDPNDPAIMVLAVTALLVVALLAGYLPARRASRVDPTVALRHE